MACCSGGLTKPGMHLESVQRPSLGMMQLHNPPYPESPKEAEAVLGHPPNSLRGKWMTRHPSGFP